MRRRAAGFSGVSAKLAAATVSASVSAKSYGALQVTACTRSMPSMCGTARAFSIKACASCAPVAMMPRMTPAERSLRVSARVSTSAMATMPCFVR